MNRPNLKTQAKRFLVRRIAKVFGPQASVAEIADEANLDRHFVSRVLREMKLPHQDGRNGSHTVNLINSQMAPVDVVIRGSMDRAATRARVFD